MRHGFLNDSASAVAANPLFADLLKRRVTFYRRKLPVYASIVHPGGAPEWTIHAWLQDLTGAPQKPVGVPALETLRADIAALEAVPTSHDELVADLLDAFTPQEFVWMPEDYAV